MIRRAHLLVMLAAAATPSSWAHAADAPPPDAVELLARNSHPFSYSEAALGGPGAERLLGYAAEAQFVLFGEEHMDHAVPIFAGAARRRQPHCRARARLSDLV